VRRKREKNKRRKKKTIKENMMKMKWLYSSRNLTSSSRREDLIREKGKRNQGKRGCAIIVVKMVTSLSNVHMRGRKKTMTRERCLTKATRKIRNTLRRSLMVQLMLAKNGTQSDKSSESESDEVATIAIKGKTSSSKSLFPKLSKHTYLMVKEGRKKVKPNTSSSPKYVTSYEDILSNDNYDSSDNDNPLLSELVKKSNVMIKGLMRQVGARDELLEQQEELLVQERKISEELKKLLALEKGKMEKLDQELTKNKENTCNRKSSIGAL
jgi:hypothetical protein